jgi:hypothetical protein
MVAKRFFMQQRMGTDTLRNIGSTKSPVESDLRHKLADVLSENHQDLPFFLLLQVRSEAEVRILLRDKILKLSNEEAIGILHNKVLEVVKSDPPRLKTIKLCSPPAGSNHRSTARSTNTLLHLSPARNQPIHSFS